jgi:hypothetical protein
MFGLLLVAATVGQDVTGPEILDLSVDPIYIDCTQSDQVVTVYAEVSDDLSGIDFAYCGFWSPLGTENHVWFLDHNRVDGDDMHAWYATQVVFPHYSELGMWSVEYTATEDRVGNTQRLFHDDIPFDVYVINQPIPEPSAIILLITGAIGLAFVLWRRRATN